LQKDSINSCCSSCNKSISRRLWKEKSIHSTFFVWNLEIILKTHFLFFKIERLLEDSRWKKTRMNHILEEKIKCYINKISVLLQRLKYNRDLEFDSLDRENYVQIENKIQLKNNETRTI
jgi:hypothetical protein